MLAQIVLALLASQVASSETSFQQWRRGGLIVNISDRAMHYSIDVNGIWFQSSADQPRLYCSGTWRSPGNGLNVESSRQWSGVDRLGSFDAFSVAWWSECGGFNTTFVYHVGANAYSFAQAFPNGCEHTEGLPQIRPGFCLYPATNLAALPITEFPSWAASPGTKLKQVGYLTWSGAFAFDQIQYGVGLEKFCGGHAGGPIVLFDDQNGVVFSSLSNFLTGILALRKGTGLDGDDALVAGIQGNITEIPQDFSLSFVIAPLMHEGITGAMANWGSLLRRWHGTARHRDVIVERLGYFTDNGAYFYGGNPVSGDKLATVVKDLSTLQQIPLHYLMLDPWVWEGYLETWPNGDLCEFVESPNLFPHGLQALSRDSGLPLMLYSMYWCNSSSTIYNLPFLKSAPFFDQRKKRFRVAAQIAPNSSFMFYDRIMQQHAAYLGAFEVDYMYRDLFLIPEFAQQTGSAKEWLRGMNDAAHKHGIGIQYCMGLPNFALQSLEFNSVTNFRASDDNDPWADYPVSPDRWKIGYTALLLNALDLPASFDVIYTSADQPGAYNCSRRRCLRPHVELDAAVSALSSGPVSIGDGPGFTNRSLVMRLCAADGTLLHLSRPATPIDRTFSEPGLGKTEVWVGHSLIGANWMSWTVLVVDAPDGISFSVTDLWPRPFATELLAWKLESVDVIRIHAQQPAIFHTSGNSTPFDHAFAIYTLALACPSGAAFLGERGKFVAASPQRLLNVACNGEVVCVDLRGVAGSEDVNLAFLTTSGRFVMKSVTVAGDGGHYCLPPDVYMV